MALVAATDLPFLLTESRATPMHVGGLQVFELPPDAGPHWLREQYEAMLAYDDIAPLFRQRPYRSPGTGFGWAWREDDELDIEYHVRHSALPDPHRVRELLAVGGRLHGSLLDRQRPLWEFHLIEGLEGNRFAAYTKIHHSVIDGVSALRLLERWLSPDPQAEVPPAWAARPKRSRGAGQSTADPLELIVGTAKGAVDLLGVTPALLRSARRAMTEELAGFPFKAPSTMFNVHITGARRIAAQTWSLARIKAVAKASDATLNDIVLAMCSGALRRYLVEMDALPDSALTSMVPVSLRTDDSAGGNAVGAVITSLATDVVDPSWRLARIKESMQIAKESMSSLTPVQRLALSAANMAPLPLVSALGGGAGWPPPFNVIISNVPGPREALYLNGARLQGVYPMSIPYHGQALNITLTSYEDNLEFGLTGCRRRVPHLQRLLAHLEASLVELEVAVGLSNGKPKRRAAARKPT
ncbi:MAG: wax ester/triacylglycerol synthase family O-acyltransferase [Acidimicrobiales bacterium]